MARNRGPLRAVVFFEIKKEILVREDHMKSTLRTLLVTILGVFLACGAALAQVQPSPGGPVHSRFGSLTLTMKAQPTTPANRQAQSPGSPDISFTFGMIDFPGQMDSGGSAANVKGEIVGGYGPNMVGDLVTNHGFLLKGTKFTEIDYPGAAYTEPNGMNDSGTIVGQYGASFSDEQGFKLEGKTYTTIDYPGATLTSANAINKPGDIVGYQYSGGTGHGFLLSKGVFTSIDVPGAIGTDAYGINKNGEIVGTYYDSDGNGHGFLLQNGTFTTIDYPGRLLAELSRRHQRQRRDRRRLRRPNDCQRGVVRLGAWLRLPERTIHQRRCAFRSASRNPTFWHQQQRRNHWRICRQLRHRVRLRGHGRTVINSWSGPVLHNKSTNKRSRT